MRDMNILSIENLSKTVKDEPLFENVTLGVEEGEKIGIVGKNGAGKSTFLRVISSSMVPDEGNISIRKDTNVVLLEQLVSFDSDTTLESFLYLKSDWKLECLKEYQKAIEDNNEKKYTDLYSKIEKYNLWDIERTYYAYLTDMGEDISPDRLFSTLSGGQQKKASIARALALRPDLLLLDEPTNHLDIKTIEYLENWIKSTRAAIIIVTHDRHILNECCSTIWELDRKSFYRHPGSFSSYLERKEERLMMEDKEQSRLKTILRRELEWLKRGPQARTGKDKNRKDRIDDMKSQLYKVRDDKQKEFTSLKTRLGKKILEVDNIAKGYDGNTLFSGFSHSFVKGEKLGLIGDNGSGKSTLLDILSGRIAPDEGSVDIGQNTLFGYYDQKGRELESSKTVLEYAESFGDRIRFSDDEDVTAARFLEIFGFPSSMHRTPISLLSGGERRRLYLITRLISNPNFLLFDEPTNDLDIETMENLEGYLTSFPGCMIISSHDRTLLDVTVDMLLVIEGKKITLFPGNYSEWKKFKEDEEKKEEIEDKEKPLRQEKKQEKSSKGLSFKEKKELENIEIEIANLEDLIGELESSFATADTTELGTLAERTVKYNDAKKTLDEKTERWLELSEKA